MHQSFLIKNILDQEWGMFTTVKSATPAPCQEAPDVFRMIRGSIFETWTEETLTSYLADLTKARDEGRNLLKEKYARMDNLIPRGRNDPLVDEIILIEEQWQKEIMAEFPNLYRRSGRGMRPTGDGSNFSIYLRSELETYGPRTIILYHQSAVSARKRGLNLARQSLEILVKKSGYQSLAQAETLLGLN